MARLPTCKRCFPLDRLRPGLIGVALRARILPQNAEFHPKYGRLRGSFRRLPLPIIGRRYHLVLRICENFHDPSVGWLTLVRAPVAVRGICDVVSDPCRFIPSSVLPPLRPIRRGKPAGMTRNWYRPPCPARIFGAANSLDPRPYGAPALAPVTPRRHSHRFPFTVWRMPGGLTGPQRESISTPASFQPRSPSM